MAQDGGVHVMVCLVQEDRRPSAQPSLAGGASCSIGHPDIEGLHLDSIPAQEREGSTVVKEMAATCIQAAYRGYTTRKRLEEENDEPQPVVLVLHEKPVDPQRGGSRLEFDVDAPPSPTNTRESAATTIQAHIRGMVARKQVSRMKVDLEVEETGIPRNVRSTAHQTNWTYHQQQRASARQRRDPNLKDQT